MDMLSVSLDLRDTLVLVVGGGKVATQRIERILAAGARVTLVEPAISEEVAALLARFDVDAVERAEIGADSDVNTSTNEDAFAAKGQVSHLKMTWAEFVSTHPEPRFKLVCACTDRVEVNEEVATFGRTCGAFVNRVDIGRSSSLHFSAESRVGDIRMTIATGGAAPVVSRAMREVFERDQLPQWAERAAEVARIRDAAKALPKGRKSRFWAALRQRLVETSGDDPGFEDFAESLLERLSR